MFAHYYAAHAFGIHIPFGQMLAFLPVIFMIAALPITVAHLGSTQAAWIFFFSQYAPAPKLLAFSLAAHLVFASTRAFLGVLWLPVAYLDLVPKPAEAEPATLLSVFETAVCCGWSSQAGHEPTAEALVLKDVRHAVRVLLHAKGWTAVVLLSLALGIGANTAIFSAVNGLLLKHVPVKDPDSLVRLRNAGRNDMVTSSSDYGFTAKTADGQNVRTHVLLSDVSAVRR